MSECVIAIDHAEQQELVGLADKAEQLAELIHAGFPEAKSGGYPPTFQDCGAGFVILDTRTAVAILAPRTLEIAFGRVMPKLKLKPVSRRYMKLRDRVQALFPLATPIDQHTFAIEFDGATFNVEITVHEDGDICTTFECFFSGYEEVRFGFYDIEDLIELGASDWLYDVLSPPSAWTPYSVTPAFRIRPDVGLRF